MTWATKRLNEVADLCLGKMLDAKKNRGELLPYLANINVRWGSFDFEDLREMRFETRELDRYGLKYGDIVMCEGGEPGRCAIWKSQVPGMMIQKALHRIRPFPSLDNRFLYYTFLSKGHSGKFASLFTGSTIKHLPKEKLALIEIDIPPMPTQVRIASILSAYDDLIENNRRRIKLLEESARLLYQEWFINFRFPGHEKTMFSNGLPEGWKRLTISDVADTVGGGTPSTNVHQYWEDGNVVWFVPKDLTNNRSIVLLDSERKITALGLSKSSAKMLPPETILMSSRASIGYFGIYEGACCTNQGFISCIPKLDYVRMYLLHNLMQRVNEIIGLAGGTTYKEINKTTFRAMSVILPEDKLLKTFDELAYTCLKQCRILMKQNQRLAEARDLLLPRLMSGEIEV